MSLSPSSPALRRDCTLPETPAAASPRRRRLLRSTRLAAAATCLAITLGTWWVYWPVRSHGFVSFDDPEYVTENPMVQGGLTRASVEWALTTGYNSYWHPLTWLSHMADVQFFGRGAGGPHLVNLCLHLANILLLWVVLRQLTGAFWRTAVVVALFALHPLHVESVAWVAERKDVLSAFFFLLTVWAYVRAVRGGGRRAGRGGASGRAARGVTSESAKGRGEDALRGEDGSASACHSERSEESTVSPVDEPAAGGALPLPLDTCPRPSAPGAVRWYVIALLFFACGLMSKPMVVTLPCVLLLLDWWPLGRMEFGLGLRGAWWLVREKIPFFALTFAASVVTYLAQQQNDVVQTFDSLPMGARLGNAVIAYARYLGKTVWPTDLAFFYPHPGSWPMVQVVSTLLLLVAITLAVLGCRRRQPYALVGWLWFVGMLVPTIGLIQVGSQSIADRYMYLPHVGLFLAVVWGAAELAARRAWARALLGVTAGLAVIGCGLRARDQIRHWRDSETLFRHALVATERNYMAHNNLGNALYASGRVDEAIVQYEKTLAIRPDSVNALNNLSTALLRKGRVAEAIEQLERALEISPDHLLIQHALCRALFQAGRGREAVPHLRSILLAEPGNAQVHADLGLALLQADCAAEAVGHLEKALKSGVDDPEVRGSLGRALLRLGRPDEAIPHLERAAAQRPRAADIHYDLAIARFQVGEPEAAVPHFEIVVRIQPTNAEALNNFGSTLLALGRYDDAIARFEATLRAQPDAPTAHTNIALALIRQGRARDAIARYETLLRFHPDHAESLGGLAWLLATWPDASVRDGARAVECARRANDLAGDDPTILRALAAAYAETGDFTAAQATASHALTTAETVGNADLATAIRTQLEGYAARRPHREAGEPRQSGEPLR